MYYPPNQQGLVITKNLLLSMDTQVGSMLIMQSGGMMMLLIGLLETLSPGEVLTVEFQLILVQQHVQIVFPLQIGITTTVLHGYHSLHQLFQLHAHKLKVRKIHHALLTHILKNIQLDTCLQSIPNQTTYQCSKCLVCILSTMGGACPCCL